MPAAHGVSSTATLTRRTCLAALFTTSLGLNSRAGEIADRDVNEVTTALKQAGLSPVRTIETANYLAVGNASEQFLRLTLSDCEAVADSYMEHFRSKGFEVVRPAHRMAIVALADVASFIRFIGAKIEGPKTNKKYVSVTMRSGEYSQKTNRLIVFDLRNRGVSGGGQSGNLNMSTLTHEATHQLTFNTGLLNREGDIPRCIGEGLGTYGEVHRLNVRPTPGQRNLDRLDDLAKLRRRKGNDWIPLSELLVQDALIQGVSGPLRQLLGYAESWLLIYYLMNDSSRLPGFRSYLAAIKSRKSNANRLEDAQTHLGDLDQLDRDLQRFSIQLLKTM